MNRRRILTLFAGTCLILGLILLLTNSKPKRYEGRTIAEWIFRLDANVNSRAEHDEASDVLCHSIRASAVPAIQGILKEDESNTLTLTKDLLRRFRILPAEKLSLPEKQFRAGRAAYKIAEDGVDISSLVPLLTFHLTNSSYADTELGRALASAGPRGVMALTNFLINGDQRIRDRAAVSLHHARDKPGVLEAFIRATADSDRAVRFAAASGLSGRVHAETNIVVPIGLKFLQNKDPYERWAGAMICAAYAGDEQASNALRTAMSDTNENVRSTAERGLRRLSRNQ